jgi:CHAD domain-containing protein
MLDERTLAADDRSFTSLRTRFGDSASKPRLSLRPDRRCDEALRTILGHLRQTVAANVDGVISDMDVEFLHDLRVAIRRARSALSQIKGVLPQPAVDRLAAELQWLGEITNPCRDLDVFLLGMGNYRRQVGAAANALGDFEKLLRRERSKVLRRVRGALRSKRFTRLMDEWRALVESKPSGSDPAHAARPISDIAGKKILKACRRMVKHGAGLTDDPSAKQLHRLRIDAKKLRYLLEFFRSLYPAERVDLRIRELKGLQNVLGELNDREIQRARLAVMTRELEGTAGAGTLAAMSDLGTALDRRQKELRAVFRDRFDPILSTAAQREYRALFDL